MVLHTAKREALSCLREELISLASPEQAKISMRFFKTGKGEYGEGDAFLGIKVPVTRTVAKKYANHLTLEEVRTLLYSTMHEERLAALLVLIHKYEGKKTTDQEKKMIFDFYLANRGQINNWDLVDLSSHEIVGSFLFNHPQERTILITLATSPILWERRIAMVSQYHFIYRKSFDEPLKIAQLLLHDEHDLLHKAVGWMLREIGKRDLSVEEAFLKKHYQKMPRTMLRYAIERFPEKKRKAYLQGKI